MRRGARLTGRIARVTPEQPWWRNAVFYQIYPRSFADGNGDGTGDLIGMRERLDYLVELGVDALWLSPFYRSPMADGGYDVADPCDVDPLFGTLADFDALVAAAHERGVRITVDIVPNHFSDQHAWFQQALAAPPGSPERARFIFRDGRGEHGELPPNNWPSVFGGPAWRRVPDGQWYLHLFAPEQPDLDWDNPRGPSRVRAHPAVLARPRRRRVPRRRRAFDGQAGRAARPGPVAADSATRRADAVRATIRAGIATACTSTCGCFGASSTPTRATGWRSARRGCPMTSGSRATSDRTS